MNKKKQLISVKEYIIHRPHIDVVDSIITDVVSYCGCKYFHSLDKQFDIYDLNFTNIKYNKTENIILKNITGGWLPLLMRIQKKLIDGQCKYKFKEINKVTIKIQGVISGLNICYYLKLPLSM